MNNSSILNTKGSNIVGNVNTKGSNNIGNSSPRNIRDDRQ